MATNTITPATAEIWAKNWQSDSKNTIKAFLIPKEDITQLFKYEGVCDVRTYLGIDSKGINKLMIVGVDANGNDMIDEAKQQYIYDFTRPCPQDCDLKSRLFNPKP